MKITRHQNRRIHVGSVEIGGGSPISIQSMTNTLTQNIDATVEQIASYAQQTGLPLFAAVMDADAAGLPSRAATAISTTVTIVRIVFPCLRQNALNSSSCSSSAWW